MVGIVPIRHANEAMALCKYAGPPALFTMQLCLMGSKDMNFDFRWLETMAPRIAATQQSILEDVKIAPTPCYCCLSVLHACDGDGVYRFRRCPKEGPDVAREDIVLRARESRRS